MKMPTNKIYAVLMAAATIGFSACEKKLDLVNPNAPTSASFWNTGTDAIKGINAAYASLLIDGSYMRSTPLMMDTRGDDAKSNSPWLQMYNTGKFALNTADGAIYAWSYGAWYEGISKANQVLNYVPAIEMDAALKDRIMGQAYFLRGLYFFHLANFWGNVAYPTSLPASKDEFYMEQESAEQGWDKVIADFQQAANLLPVSYDAVGGPDQGQKGRATKGAALAYLGKAHMFHTTKKDYTAAAAAFKAVIDLGVYDLMPNYRDNFTEVAENNKESIFEVQFDLSAGGTELGWGGTPSSGWGKTSARAITYGPRGFGFVDVQPTRSVFNSFLEEKTAGGDDDPRLVATMFYNKPGLKLYGQEFSVFYGGNPADLNDLFCRKYENDETKPNEFDWRSGINERLMRYADVLLMYAECLNENGSTAQAYPYIQRVRSRVGLPDLAVTKPGMTQAQMRDQIAQERLLEFCLEGKRFDDIRRWGWLQDPAKLALLKSRDPEFNSYQAGREYFPIPQSEIDINRGWKQNLSY
ncbi:RagB/SusD family nutrient uptake outer membrane protein [Flavihumibacter stibioxidans]|nr:RagB/SusD family nutrient uptake outer membrane protein [Flavihumibacter stibioxidans]